MSCDEGMNGKRNQHEREAKREKSNKNKTHEFLFSICNDVTWMGEEKKFSIINHHYFYDNNARILVVAMFLTRDS